MIYCFIIMNIETRAEDSSSETKRGIHNHGRFADLDKPARISSPR